MAFELPAHIQEKIATARADYAKKHAVFATLSNADLATSAQFWMQHCRAPKQIEPGIPVYDSTFWHIILPEMIRRLQPADRSSRGKGQSTPNAIPSGTTLPTRASGSTNFTATSVTTSSGER